MARIDQTIGPTGCTTGGTTLFTVPTGERYVVRHIHVSNSNAAQSFSVTKGGNLMIDAYPLAATGSIGSQVDYWCKTAFEAAATLIVTLQTATEQVTVDYDRIILG